MSKVACSGSSRTIRKSRLPIRSILPIGILLTVVIALSAFEVLAQAPDSIDVPSEIRDSTLVNTPLTQRRMGPPLEIGGYIEGVIVDSIPIVRAYAHDLVELLDALPATFRYSTGNLGWPDQVSFDGFAPDDVSLTLDGIPMQDPVTGRPLFEILPSDLLTPLALFGGRHGSVAGVGFQTRRFNFAVPHTELRYRAGSPGLQSISASHVQQRRVRPFGSPAALQVLFRYASGKWGGEYPDSESDVSQIYGRIGLQSTNWALRLSNLHTRRHGGAHGGVEIRPGSDFDTIYTTFNATVDHPNATFRIKRNDFRIAFDRALLEGVRPLSLQFSWAAHIRRYRDVDALEAKINEYTLSATQELPGFLPRQTMVAHIISRFDRVTSGTVFSDTTVLSRSNLEALIESGINLGATDIEGHLGVVGTDGHLIPEGRFFLTSPMHGYVVTMEAMFAGRAPSRLEKAGAQHIAIVSSGEPDVETLRQLSLAADRKLGTSRARLKIFASSTGSPLDVWRVAPDSFRIAQGAKAITWYGLTGEYGWRYSTKHGLYGAVESTFQNSSAPSDDAFLNAVDRSLPSFHARVRVGARYQLFLGDLDMDVYAVGRYWSSFSGRYYDPVTGVLAVPEEGARTIGNSGTLDLRLEADIRSATAFVGFENILAGLSYPGTVLVPTYPLAAQAIRFGLLWPIDN